MSEKDLNTLFDEAFANAQLIPQESVPQDMQLVLYGLYKQATSESTNKLYFQNPPNDGILVERGSLGIDITSSNGFDIGSRSQKAYLLATVGNETKIFTVSTTTGSATMMANYPNAVKGFAVGLGF